MVVSDASPRAGRARPGAVAALRHPQFRRVWAAVVVSQVGDWMQIAGRAFLVFDLTGSTSDLGAIYFFSYTPQLLFSMFGGVLADRYPRRRVLITAQTFQTAGAAAMGLLALTGSARLWNVALLSFVLGTVQSLSQPASMALVPALVPKADLPGALSLWGATNSITRVTGPLLAGALIPRIGVEWTFFINAGSFVGVIVVWLLTRITHVETERKERGLRAIREGLRYVRRTREIAVPIAATAFLSAIGLIYQPLAIAYATEVLAGGDKKLGAEYFGSLQAAIGLGAAVGILGLADLGRRRPAAAFLGTAFVFSLALATLGLVSSFPVAVAVFAVIGAFHFSNATLALTIVQHATSEVMRGRVLAVHMVAWVGIFPITSLMGGAIAEHVGLPTTMGVAGLACAAFTAGLYRWRDAIRLEAGDDDRVEGLSMMVSVPDEER